MSTTMDVLHYAKAHGPVSAREVADELRLDRETVRQAIYRLVKRKLMEAAGTRWPDGRKLYRYIADPPEPVRREPAPPRRIPAEDKARVISRALSGGELTVAQIVEATGLSEPTVRKHLRSDPRYTCRDVLRPSSGGGLMWVGLWSVVA